MCALHASAVVCHRSGCSVTLTNPRSRYCSAACRQAAHRQSPAHATYLATLRIARRLRRETHASLKRRDTSLHQYRGHGGPRPAGLAARFGDLNLQPFKVQARAVAHA